MEHPWQSKQFWTLSALLAAILFIFFLNSGREYQTQSEILIIPRNEKTSAAINQITANATKIPFSLSFYDNLLQNNEKIIDENLMASPSKRKSAWASKLEVERLGDSSILQITTFSSSRAESEMLNEAVIDGLISELGRLYDIRRSIDVRILDSFIISEVSRANLWGLGLKSIFWAILWGAGIYYMLVFIYQQKSQPRNITYPKIQFPKVNIPSKESLTDSLSYFDLFPKAKKEEKTPEVKESLKTISAKEEEGKKKVEIPSPTVAPGAIKKSSAPSNLPIANEADVFKIKKELYPEKKKKEAPEEILKEPTEEEVKERLNKLLSGKF